MKKRLIILAAALVCVAACAPKEPSVMARFVPERCDDFIFENDLVCGRFYGEALESCGVGQVTSPGVDVWVKLPGGLVANQRYKDELENGKTYHKDWGNGKDCYKVARSLGAGASAPIENDTLQLPVTNFRSWKMVEEKPNKVVFTISYPQWTTSGGVNVSLDKTITVVPGTYFVKSEDCYTFTGADSIIVAAGINRHPAQEILSAESLGNDRCMLWENASDQSVEPEDGMIGVGVVMPGADKVGYTADSVHSICCKKVASGEILTYYFGSCWSKGDIKDAETWFNTVNNVK